MVIPQSITNKFFTSSQPHAGEARGQGGHNKGPMSTLSHPQGAPFEMNEETSNVYSKTGMLGGTTKTSLVFFELISKATFRLEKITV
jgi:hypothetical protein